MKRQRLEELLVGYLDGELIPTERDEVDALLQHDPEARQLLTELQATVRLLGQLARESAPEDLAEQVVARIERSALLSARPRSARQRWARVSRWAGSVAAAAAAVIIAVLVVQTETGPYGPKPEPVSPPVEVAKADRAKEADLRKTADARNAETAVGIPHGDRQTGAVDEGQGHGGRPHVAADFDGADTTDSGGRTSGGRRGTWSGEARDGAGNVPAGKMGQREFDELKKQAGDAIARAEGDWKDLRFDAPAGPSAPGEGKLFEGRLLEELAEGEKLAELKDDNYGFAAKGGRTLVAEYRVADVHTGLLNIRKDLADHDVGSVVANADRLVAGRRKSGSPLDFMKSSIVLGGERAIMLVFEGTHSDVCKALARIEARPDVREVRVATLTAKEKTRRTGRGRTPMGLQDNKPAPALRLAAEPGGGGDKAEKRDGDRPGAAPCEEEGPDDETGGAPTTTVPAPVAQPSQSPCPPQRGEAKPDGQGEGCGAASAQGYTGTRPTPDKAPVDIKKLRPGQEAQATQPDEPDADDEGREGLARRRRGRAREQTVRLVIILRADAAATQATSRPAARSED